MNNHPTSRPLLLLRSLQAAFKALSASDPLRLAGATAFFTTFALPAILIIILSVLRLVFIPRNISRQLFRDLEGSNINSIYGASASMVLLLLFVFYCSLIFYFGASFTNAWADANGVPVEPLPYAKKYRIMDVKENENIL